MCRPASALSSRPCPLPSTCRCTSRTAGSATTPPSSGSSAEVTEGVRTLATDLCGKCTPSALAAHRHDTASTHQGHTSAHLQRAHPLPRGQSTPYGPTELHCRDLYSVTCTNRDRALWVGLPSSLRTYRITTSHSIYRYTRVCLSAFLQ